MKKRHDRPRQHASYAIDVATGEMVDDGLERRQHQRLPSAWEGTIHDGGREIPGTIANVSASGALVIAVHELALDTVVILQIDPFGHLPARVVWSEPDRCGLKFLDTPQRVAQRLGLADLIQHSGNIEFIPF